jgi:hypothetical protein
MMCLVVSARSAVLSRQRDCPPVWDMSVPVIATVSCNNCVNEVRMCYLTAQKLNILGLHRATVFLLVF